LYCDGTVIILNTLNVGLCELLDLAAVIIMTVLFCN